MLIIVSLKMMKDDYGQPTAVKFLRWLILNVIKL